MRSGPAAPHPRGGGTAHPGSPDVELRGDGPRRPGCPWRYGRSDDGQPREGRRGTPCTGAPRHRCGAGDGNRTRTVSLEGSGPQVLPSQVRGEFSRLSCLPRALPHGNGGGTWGFALSLRSLDAVAGVTPAQELRLSAGRDVDPVAPAVALAGSTADRRRGTCHPVVRTSDAGQASDLRLRVDGKS